MLSPDPLHLNSHTTEGYGNIHFAHFQLLNLLTFWDNNNFLQHFFYQFGVQISASIHQFLHSLRLKRICHCMKYLFSTQRIFPLASRRHLAAGGVLMQIRPRESTYFEHLTFVLIYWIISATKSLKPDPPTSSFLSLLTLTGRAWQVEVLQSSLIMWNKSIRPEIGDALILPPQCTVLPTFQVDHYRASPICYRMVVYDGYPIFEVKNEIRCCAHISLSNTFGLILRHFVSCHHMWIQ